MPPAPKRGPLDAFGQPSGPAKARRDQAMAEWNSRWSGWELGTLPKKAHAEADAIHGAYAKAQQAEVARVAAAPKKKPVVPPKR